MGYSPVMDTFYAMALSPFMLLVMLLIARPLVVLIRRFMPDGPLKRLLFIRW